MNYEEFTYPSASGTDTIAASLWTPSLQNPKGILQITHGMCEHMGRYETFAQFMARNGLIVCGQDQLGHGRTAESKESLGFFAEKNGHTYLVEDVRKLYKVISERFPGLPYFLLGHSMGSFITRKYVTQYADGLSGHICSGTAGPNPALGFGVWYASRQCRIKGPQSAGHAINKLIFGASYKHTGRQAKEASPDTPHTGFAWLSRDPSVWEQFGSDPKCNYLFTNAGFRDMLTLYRDVSAPAWFRNVPKALPLLLASGGRDVLGERGKGIRALQKKLTQSGLKDLHVKLYEGARHEILNETNKNEVYEDMLAWIMERLPPESFSEMPPESFSLRKE